MFKAGSVLSTYPLGRVHLTLRGVRARAVRKNEITRIFVATATRIYLAAADRVLILVLDDREIADLFAGGPWGRSLQDASI